MDVLLSAALIILSETVGLESAASLCFAVLSESPQRAIYV